MKFIMNALFSWGSQVVLTLTQPKFLHNSPFLSFFFGRNSFALSGFNLNYFSVAFARLTKPFHCSCLLVGEAELALTCHPIASSHRGGRRGRGHH